MTMIKQIILLALFLSPSIVFAHDDHNDENQRQERWGSRHVQQSYYDYRDHNHYEKGYSRHEQKKKQHKKQVRKSDTKVKAGWDVNPRIAKRASNCYKYSLSAQGGKGSARIMSIPGKNYIQVAGQKSGYVCFQGDPTLELGKLGNPNIKVKFKLEGNGSYAFGRGKTGSNYKNNWYRSYWGL
ncbi:MAG: hypothetical protein ACI8ZB_004076 [Desulforhopalus sp.]|jgi:hypothetical protein